MADFRNHLSTVDGMPPLWPTGPSWPNDQQVFEEVMSHIPPQVAGFARMMTDNYVRQRRMDKRWRRLGVVIEEAKGEGEKPWKEWYEKVVRGTGWVIHSDEVDPEWVLSGEAFYHQAMELMKSGLFELDDQFQDAAGQKGGLCDACKTPCESECMCGELFCSRACMKKSWKSHKELCATVYDNAGIAMTLTQIEFTKLRNVDVEACLGKTKADTTSALPPAFASQRPRTERRKKPKPNEACPCDSGKKYKKCCGDPARLA